MKHSLHQCCRVTARFTFIRLLLFAHICLLASLTSLQAQTPTIRYVKFGGTGEGLTWGDASGDLQVMMDQSQPGDQVWVSAEVLKPGTERWHSFALRPGVAVYGGFNGTETSIAERQKNNFTILSGDIGTPVDPTDNCYHVFAGAIADNTAIIDGFLIMDGYADGEDDDGHGAGMLNTGGCTTSSPTFRNCFFAFNRAKSGAAFYSEGAGNHPLLINCAFWGNEVLGDGAGGAITVSGSAMTLVNCTLVRNRAKQGNAIRNEGTMTLTNCILWNNKPNYDGEIQDDDDLDITGAGTTTITYSINQDHISGMGNQVADPGFANEASGDLELTACSFAINSGNLDAYTAVSGTEQDILFQNRVYGDYIDKGAFEFQGESTIPQVSVTPTSPTVCEGQSVTLTASGGDTYLWSTLETTAAISVTATGTYSVTVTNASNCSNTESVSVTVGTSIPPPTLTSNPAAGSPGSLTVSQNSPAVSLSASGCSGTLVWTGPGSPSGSPISVPTSTTGTFAYSVYCQQGTCISPTASFTVIVTPAPPVTGSFDGFLYGADCSSFRGWAWDRNKPNTVFSVDIYDGATYKITIAANEFRQDLKDAGKGNGIHAFRWAIPDALKDGQVHSLSARVAGSDFTLKSGPKTIQCQTGTPPPPANKPPVAPTVAAITAQKEVNFTTTLPAFTDPESGTLSHGLAGLPSGLTFTSGTRQINGKTESEGSFVLTYSATDDKGATSSVSINLTVAGSTPVVTGSFEGYLDKVECGTIRGWVWDRNKPNTPVTVEFYTGSTVWGSVVANIYRVDLKDAGKGNGAHAYSFEVPPGLKDGMTRLISARVSGSTYVLKDSGKPLTCSSPVRLSAASSEGFQVTVLGNPVSDQLEVEVRGAKEKPLRFVLMDVQGRIVAEHLIPQAEAVEYQRFEIRNQPAGLLLLRVSTATQNRTLKVVKH